MQLEKRPDADRSTRTKRAVFVPALLALSFVAGCAAPAVRREGASQCALFDSLFARSGFESPLSIVGQATVDANQYRVRGLLRLEAKRPGELTFEFTSTVFFGHQREDFVLSLVPDTVRIVDRERGTYHEGRDAESFLSEALDTDLDVSQALSLAFGGRPECEELTDVRCEPDAKGRLVCTGRTSDGKFRAAFSAADRRLVNAEWPVGSKSYGVDRLRAEYDWGSGGGGETDLRGMVLSLEKREWRCRITASGG